jgi:hypothetical protein
MKIVFILLIVIFHLSFSEDGLRISSAPYISGDTFRSWADHLYDETCKNFDPDSVKYGDIIFVKGDLLTNFYISKHNFIINPYVLVVHNSDDPFSEKFGALLDDDKILECFAQNIENYSHKKLSHLPIGLANRCWSHGSTETFKKVQSEISKIPKEYLLYLNISVNTNAQERAPIYDLFKNKSWCLTSSSKPLEKYLKDLAKSKFVLSPRGNGLDCHRTWEALYMGAIPIVKKSDLDEMYNGLPVLIVNDWSDITEEFLKAEYKKISCNKNSIQKLQALYWFQRFNKYKSYENSFNDLQFNPSERLLINFSKEPIDVVIPCVEKDLDVLNYCILSIRAFCRNIRKIYVVSKTKLTIEAEWFDESKFPFNKLDIAKDLMKSDTLAIEYLADQKNRAGWYFQQLLKLYAPFVIPDISSNVLVVDADLVFLKPVYFQNENGAPLFNITTEHELSYFRHIKRLLPGLTRVKTGCSGVAHHMLFQRQILASLFKKVEQLHEKPFWRVFCDKVSEDDIYGSGASEYEMYFNFVLSVCPEAQIRFLKMESIDNLRDLLKYQKKYDCVVLHSWMKVNTAGCFKQFKRKMKPHIR